MEKIDKLNRYNDLKLKVLSLGTASVILFNNSSVLTTSNVKKIFENNKPGKFDNKKQIVEELSTDAFDLSNYNIVDTMTIAGRTLVIVTDINEEEIQNDNIDIEYDTEHQLSEDGVLPEGYVEPVDYNLDFGTIDEIISFYSKVFELKEDVTSELIYDILDNNSYGWQYGQYINGVEYNDIEEAIARICCDISYYPEDYGLTEEDIRSLDGYQLDQFLPEELIYKFSTLLGVNPNIALAIAYAESGRCLDSLNFQNNNNVGGIVGSNGYVHYRNQATGLFKFIMMLSDKYNVTMESGSDKINSMASSYCEIPDYWINLVGGIYYELDNYGYDYSYNTYNYQDRDLILCGQVNIEDDIQRERN